MKDICIDYCESTYCTNCKYKDASKIEKSIGYTKAKLDTELLLFRPEITFAVAHDVRLVIEVDAFNGHLNWSVYEGDYVTDFNNYEDARDYFVENGGEF